MDSSAQNKNFGEGLASGEKLKRSNSCPVGTSGKSCHQCRQKKEDFAATCKNLKKGKHCPIKFCHKCLLTRYGENAEEVGQLADWTCPKCRGFCNCSLCQKRRGEQPTGPLYREAKQSGFNSVAEMLVAQKASQASIKEELEVLPSGEPGKENDSNVNNVIKVCNNVDDTFEGEIARSPNIIEEEILLPTGNELKEIFGIELPPKHVGNALQLLEFCRVFGKVIDLKEGEAETIIKELVGKEIMHEENTSVIEFHIRVLTLIMNDSGNESPSLPTRNESNLWLKQLGDLIMKSYHIPNDFSLDWLQEGISGYYKLDLSTKFKLMTFLCDEALNTEVLRSYIHEENSRHTKELKETKLKVAAAKKKIKCLEQKLQNEKAKVVPSTGSPSLMEEHDALLKRIRNEVDETHTEISELKGTIQNEKSGCHAMRTKPEFLDDNGKVFWKLESYKDESVVLVQDIKFQNETMTSLGENWFVYSPAKKDEVDRYISSRVKRLKKHKVSHGF